MKEHAIEVITKYVVSEAIGVFDALTLLSGIAKGRPEIPRDLAKLYADLSADEKTAILVRVRNEVPELAAIGGALK
jgi:hypothetical protein